MVDSIGHMYLRGLGVAQDFAKARELFEIGAILGASGAVNNLARIHHLGLGVDPDPATAMRYYEDAVAMQNPHAPYHLATLLGELGPASPELDERRAGRSSASPRERGYAPRKRAPVIAVADCPCLWLAREDRTWVRRRCAVAIVLPDALRIDPRDRRRRRPRSRG